MSNESKDEDAVYGYCPICRAKGVTRERSPNGKTTCANGHVYPSKESLPVSNIPGMLPMATAPKSDVFRLIVRDRGTKEEVRAYAAHWDGDERTGKWMITVSTDGWRSLHGGWEPIGWMSLRDVEEREPIAADDAGWDVVRVLMDHAYNDGIGGRRLPSPSTEKAEADVRAMLTGERTQKWTPEDKKRFHDYLDEWLNLRKPEPRCDCGKKPASECEKWEPGCDLGHSPEHARAVRVDLKPELRPVGETLSTPEEVDIFMNRIAAQAPVSAVEVKVSSWEKKGHCGPQIKATVSIEVGGLVFYPLPGSGYGSASDFSVEKAEEWADQLRRAFATPAVPAEENQNFWHRDGQSTVRPV